MNLSAVSLPCVPDFVSTRPCKPHHWLHRRQARHTPPPVPSPCLAFTMHRYHIGRTLGEGAFGLVRHAVHKETGEEVAVKTLKERCTTIENMMALPEVKALRQISHRHIVQCKELILDSKHKVHIVFELLTGGNLESLTRKRTAPLPESHVRAICFQLLHAVAYMHRLHFLHRDIKPENILLQSYIPSTDHVSIKLADLGLAKHYPPNATRPNTTYVATRWYRSPELLLRIATYGFPSDMWAVGAVMAELISLGDPLFPGDDEKDQLLRVIALRGHPAIVGWEKGELAMRTRRIRVAKTTPSSLRSAVPNASPEMLQLITDLLEMDPGRRPSASEALGYPVFVIGPQKWRGGMGRKRRKMGGGEEVETAGTVDCASSGWSEGSELAGVETHPFRAENMDGNRGRVLVGRKEAGKLETDQEVMFNIPKFERVEARGGAKVVQGMRLPAGHFNLRA